MHYIVDGHNLIPHVKGLSLSDPDDETKLIEVLRNFCRLKRDTILVFFDQASPGNSGRQSFGAVQAIFVPRSITADNAIIAHFKKAGPSARNWTLVSSDRAIQAAARSRHVQVLPSREFAMRLETESTNKNQPDPMERPLSDSEILQWEALFNQHEDSDGQFNN